MELAGGYGGYTEKYFETRGDERVGIWDNN